MLKNVENIEFKILEDAGSEAAERAKKEYNEIAFEYQEATKRKLREYAYNPSWKKILGNLKSKTVCDWACGEGISSRLSRNLGANKVVGFDISEKLIKKAVEQDKNISPDKRIRYIVGDVMNVPIKGKFDIITGAMMLNYLPSLESIKKVANSIKEHLKSEGIFYASLPNSERMKGSDSYGVKMTPESQKEGSKVRIELSDFDGNKFHEFSNYRWDGETYANIFEEAGFEVEWMPSEISPEGIEELGENFWKEYKENPVYIMMKAKLKE